MKAIVVHETGGPEVLQIEEVDSPEPGAGEARIRGEAAGLNFIDIYNRTGSYPMDPPFTPGREAAGVVDAVGDGVTEVEVGDRVGFVMRPGAYAEEVVVPEKDLVSVPEELDLETAAAALLQGLTAHYLAVTTYPIQEGDTALVHAAAGGVGHILTQIVKLRGGTVIGTVSTEEKAELARGYGADHVIRYTEMDFEEETKRLTDGAGVEVVYDSVGKDTFHKSLACLEKRGYMVLYGASSGPVEPIDPQILNRGGSLFLTRPSLGHYVDERQELVERARDLFGWITGGQLEVRIDRSFPLADAGKAHEYMEARKTKGKVLLVP
ncbi:MAG: quinone oxidoreductase family protein [Gemmatimonadota bacterium]